MKKLFKMGLVLILILSVFCACNPNPETEKHDEETIIPGETGVVVKVNAFEGAAKYVVSYTNEDDVTLKSASETASFKARSGVNYQVGVSAYSADGKLIATGYEMVIAAEGMNSVTITLNAVTERVLSRIDTSIAIGETGPEAGALEECLILNNDGTFTRSYASVIVTMGAGEQPATYAAMPPEGEHGSNEGPVLVPEYVVENTKGTYSEDGGSIVLTAEDGTTVTVLAEDYELLAGKPFSDELNKGLLSLGSIAIKASDLDALAKMGLQMGLGAIPEYYQLPESIQAILSTGVLAEVNKDIVLDLYLQLRTDMTKIYADIHFEGDKNDPILSVLNGNIALRDPLALKFEAELPFIYREGKIVLEDGTEVFDIALTQKAGNSVVCADFSVPLQGGGALDLSVPLRRVDWKPWLSGSAFKEEKTFAPKNIEFKKLYKALMGVAGDPADQTNKAPADLEAYINKVAAFSWNGEDLTGIYKCTNNSQYDFVMGRPIMVLMNNLLFSGSWYTKGQTYVNPPTLRLSTENGKEHMMLQMDEFVRDESGKLTGIKATLIFTDGYNNEVGRVENLEYKKTDRNVPLYEDMATFCETAPAKMVAKTDGSLWVYTKDRKTDGWNGKDSGLKYEQNRRSFVISLNEEALANMVNGNNPESHFHVPFKANIYLHLPFLGESCVIAPFMDANGSGFGLKLI